MGALNKMCGAVDCSISPVFLFRTHVGVGALLSSYTPCLTPASYTPYPPSPVPSRSPSSPLLQIDFCCIPQMSIPLTESLLGGFDIEGTPPSIHRSLSTSSIGSMPDEATRKMPKRKSSSGSFSGSFVHSFRTIRKNTMDAEAAKDIARQAVDEEATSAKDEGVVSPTSSDHRHATTDTKDWEKFNKTMLDMAVRSSKEIRAMFLLSLHAYPFSCTLTRAAEFPDFPPEQRLSPMCCVVSRKSVVPPRSYYSRSPLPPRPFVSPQFLLTSRGARSSFLWCHL